MLRVLMLSVVDVLALNVAKVSKVLQLNKSTTVASFEKDRKSNHAFVALLFI
jgi:hypothetical protein